MTMPSTPSSAHLATTTTTTTKLAVRASAAARHNNAGDSTLWWLSLTGELALVVAALAIPGVGTALEAASEASEVAAHATGLGKRRRPAGGPRVIYG